VFVKSPCSGTPQHVRERIPQQPAVLVTVGITNSSQAELHRIHIGRENIANYIVEGIPTGSA
jgi:hypothetical protein